MDAHTLHTPPANPLRDAALHLAGRGWYVFPLARQGKRPAVTEWETRATTEPDRIARCWQAGAYNLGLACGPSGLVVLDLDTPGDGDTAPDGAEALAALAAERGAALPATYTVATPSGGWHLYFTCPAGVRLRNTAGQLAPHVDTRAGGGYVVAPASYLPHGVYDLHDDTDPAELPGWLVQALCQRPATPHSAGHEIATEHRDGYTAAALRGECTRVQHASRGQHNAVLSSAAYRLGQLTGAGLLDPSHAHRALDDAAGALITADCDCTPHETARVITAGLRAGARKPRHAAPKQEAA